jgi:hypothetical protein
MHEYAQPHTTVSTGYVALSEATQPPAPAASVAIHEALFGLKDRIDGLERRLEAVLQPEEPTTEPASSIEINGPMSAHTSDLRRHEGLIADLNRQVGSIVARLDF